MKQWRSNYATDDGACSAITFLFFFVILFNSMPHYMVILHALHNYNFSFTITFMLIVIHYNVGNNVLTSKLKINNIYNKFSAIVKNQKTIYSSML